MRILLASTVVLALACDKPSDSTTTVASASASVATTTSAVASASASVAASSSAAVASPPPAASPADPQDAKLATFVGDAAQAILNAATGKPVDAKWVSKDPAQAVNKLTDPDDKKLLDELGKDVSIVGVEMEVDELAQPSPDEHHQLNARVIQLGDKTLRWGTVATRHEKSALEDPTPGLEKSAPAVVEAGGRLTKALAGPCTMPWLAPSDVATLPATFQQELVTDTTATHAACAETAKVKGEWRSHIDDIRVIVKGNGHFGSLSSIFDVEPTTQRLVLSPIHVEVLNEAAK